MNSDTISKYRLFGKVGRLVTTVLAVICLLITATCFAATAYITTLPENALTVRVVEQTQLRFNAECFDSLWSILGGSFKYSGDSLPDYLQKSSEKNVMPPENEQFQTELKLFDRSYNSAEIHSDGSEKVMDAEAAPADYDAKGLVKVFAFASLFATSATVALWMLRRLFSVLTKCDSPFCEAVVSKMRGFAYSLLPVAFFASVSETMAESFLSAGKNGNISIQWGVLIAFVVTMALVSVFKYGVQLQKESDETL